MSDNTTMKPLTIALGAAFATSLAAGSVSAENLFGQTELAGGYMVAEAGDGQPGAGMPPSEMPNATTKTLKEGKCGEGVCGAMNMNKAPAPMPEKTGLEGKCGAGKTPMDGTGKTE